MRIQCIVALFALLALGTYAAQTDYKDRKPSEWVELLKTEPGPTFEALVQSETPPENLIPVVLAKMSDEIGDSNFYHYFDTLGPKAVPGLAEALKGSDAPLRRRATLALSVTLRREPQDALPILNLALVDAATDVRRFAAYGLAASRATFKPTTEELRSALNDQNADVRLGAMAVLLRSGAANEETVTAMKEALAGGTQAFKYLALSELVESPLCMLADRSIPVFQAALQDEMLRYTAMQGFEKMGPLARAVASELETLLKSERRGEREYAVRALQSIRQMVPPNLDYLSRQVLVALKRGDLRKQARFLSKRFERNDDDLALLDTFTKSRADRMLESGARTTIGTNEYAIVKYLGFSMEYVFEDGAWKLLYAYYSMC